MNFLQLFQVLRKLLFPFSVVYYGVTYLRNLCYDWGWLKSHKVSVPLIVIGNLSVGGTGKTPHVEFMLRQLLERGKKPAVLSRGYKRSTQGFVQVNQQSTAQEVGDEPLQIHHNFPDVPVAVHENRVEGCIQLIKQYADLDFIVLDDAYQHRRVKGDFNILLTDFQHLFTEDYVLPAGNLREGRYAKNRADVVVVTKCPEDLTAEKANTIRNQIGETAERPVFFSYFDYQKPYALSSANKQIDLKDFDGKVILTSALAKPKYLKSYLNGLGVDYDAYDFPDHHYYTARELNEIVAKYSGLDQQIILLATQKDAVKLREVQIEGEIEIFILPLEVKMLFNQSFPTEKLINQLEQSSDD